MSYATPDELKTRIGASVYDELYLVGDGPAAGDLEAAAAEIDGAIAFRYRLPITGLRSLMLLRDWNLTLAEERAFARPAGGDYTEKVKARVAQVRKYLDMIRDDAFRLPDGVENGGSSGAGGIALVQCDEPVFRRDKMKGF